MRIFYVLALMAGLISVANVLGCGWYGEDPGVGATAEEYYAKAEPIIAALEKYRSRQGAYPANLGELVPEFLPYVEWNKQDYAAVDQSYRLFFSYEGPGINSCIYSPEEGWRCSGLL